ncbi:Tigger transposable element-derived protein 6 [Araneus ventricosus]|uniref:Tigger transposable element-derived protein 6 n=1 Tax=Araneus ventricosus TaxID=182803 RepID=A0A4Y2EB15_ARAVE|nr:Tigger transposable element-derived protein 6 [Araneus ventricosus]
MSKRDFLNLAQRIEILRQYENGKSARKLAELFYCGRTQINKIIKEKDLILKEYEDLKFRGVKRMRPENLCEDWQERLPLVLAGYDDEDIFNMDETALFFRALPNKSMIQKSEEARGGKIPKERRTISFCVSASGEKEKPLVIWRCQRPRCFKEKDLNRLGVSWFANKKARVMSSIFEERLVNFDKKMGNQTRKVLLVLGNATCHAHGAQLKNVKLLFLPPNTTSKLQPLDHGITKCFKMECRQCALRHVIARMDECESASELSKKISIGDVFDWIKTSWKK